MRDWEGFVSEKLPKSSAAIRSEETVREFAAHLEDVAESARSQGSSPHLAETRAESEVKNWNRLAREVQRAKGEAMTPKQRIQQLWLPAVVPAFLALGLQVVAADANWRFRLQSGDHNSLPMFYFGWLLALPAIGALSGYWSRRAGASISYRVAASLFLAATMFLTFVTIVISWFIDRGGIVEHGTTAARVFSEIGRGSLEVVILPAIALFLGTLPFLRDTATGKPLAGA